jgi:hypothetical protein
MENVYHKLSQVKVSDKVEKKGRFDYLSWAWAWHYLKQSYPNSNRIVYENVDGIPYFTDGKFANVKVGIEVNGQEHIDYLPVTDNLNRSIPLTKITSFDINNSIQRATAKAIAMHGLGLSLWIGEDTARIPDEKKSKEVVKYTLDIGDDNWDKVMTYIVANKKLGLPKIVENLSTKYKVTKKVEKKIQSLIK